MSATIEKLTKLFYDECNLDYIETGSDEEGTWYIEGKTSVIEFNFIMTEYTIRLNINSLKKFNELINDNLVEKILLQGINLKKQAFNAINKYGELSLTTYLRF